MSRPGTPDGHRVAPRSTALTTPAARLADRGWRLRNSLWILAPIVPFGLLAWAGFLYIGFRARRRDWIIAGVLYAVAIGIAFAITPRSTPGQPSNGWGAGLAVACWVGGIVHAFLVRRTWLRSRAHADDSPWYDQPAGGPAPTAAAPQPGPHQPGPFQPPQVLPPPLRNAVNPSEYYAPTAQPHPTPTPPPQPAPAPGHSVPTTGGRRSLEVNSATREQLATLPGFTDDRVQAVLAARIRGPFQNVEQFAAAANLAPHEHHRVRALITATPPPPPRPGPNTGRVVDF